MDGYHPEPPKMLPSSIHELQRILHEAGHARLAAIERMRKIFSEEDIGPIEPPDRRAESVGAPEPLDDETALVGFVRETIERDGVSFVFGERLGKVWPVSTDSDLRYRVSAIREFAARHGWDVYLMNGGQMAMFRSSATKGD